MIYEITSKVLNVAALALDPTPERVHVYHSMPPMMNCSMLAAWANPVVWSEVFPTPVSTQGRCENLFRLVTVNLRLVRKCWPVLQERQFPTDEQIEPAVVELDDDLDAVLCALSGAAHRHELSTVPSSYQPKAMVLPGRAVAPQAGFAGWDLSVVVEGDSCCA